MLAEGRAKRARIASPRARAAQEEEEESPPTARPRSQRRAALVAIERQESAGNDDLSADKQESDGEEDGEGQEKKARFVWTPDLHHRFETAVHRLGVAQAKPQAIRQLMGCDTEDEPPTRQNIKSHLQKYRLLVQKQQVQKSGQTIPLRAGGGGHGNVGTPHVTPAMSRPPPSGGGSGGGGGGGGSGGVSCASGGPSERGGVRGGGGSGSSSSSSERLRQQVQVGLLSQLEIQAKLHEQMSEQRRTQAALGLRIAQAGPSAALERAQLQRVAQHVLMQRMMLQHLCSMLHATTVDLDQMTNEFKQDEDATVADVFDGAMLDGDGPMPQFPFDLPEPQDGAGAIEPLNQSFDYSHLEVSHRDDTHHLTPYAPT